MNPDDFTEAARAEAEKRAALTAAREEFEYGLIVRDFMAGVVWARDHLTERYTACGEDPSGPLRPLTTDERSYRYAQDLGYELPEEPR